MTARGFAALATRWYDDNARALPWRAPGTTPWGVLVSEIMLQQTPVRRVEPVWLCWVARWPRPADLAADAAGEAVRLWGTLGYPRRALRLHECAQAIAAEHGGRVPADVTELLALPGVGAYTARAVAAFAYGHRVPVVDTNVRRFLARALSGAADAAPASDTRDFAAVEQLLPAEGGAAARASVAFMEIGALICTTRLPRCGSCPVRERCAWLAAGKPPYTGSPRPKQAFAGTDRQVRGLLMGVLRESDVPVPQPALDAAWPDPVQRSRALDTLVADGLIDALPDGRFALPGVR